MSCSHTKGIPMHLRSMGAVLQVKQKNQKPAEKCIISAHCKCGNVQSCRIIGNEWQLHYLVPDCRVVLAPFQATITRRLSGGWALGFFGSKSATCFSVSFTEATTAATKNAWSKSANMTDAQRWSQFSQWSTMINDAINGVVSVVWAVSAAATAATECFAGCGWKLRLVPRFLHIDRACRRGDGVLVKLEWIHGYNLL